jgi:aminoglycoside phosphotransferase (APT) family kinase protein
MQHAPELTPVREAHRFDEAALAEYLRRNLRGFRGGLRVRQFEGGQSNPTFLLEADGCAWVLRKKPPGKLLGSAHQVDREYRVMTALRGSGVPVPATHLLCEDETVVGTPFFVMERVEGRVIAESSLPGLSPAERSAVYEHAVEVLATLHGLDPAAVGLADFGRPGNYYARQVARWTKQYEASKTDEIPEMDALAAWLPRHLPASEETRIVHGDYRIGNFILHPSEPRIVAVLDWELSTLGHPLADLAYFCQSYHAEGPGGSLRELDLAAAGIPAEANVLARYCALTGRPPIEHWSFYVVFQLFRSAAIVQGVYKRGLDGIASSTRAHEYGAAVRRLARDAWRLAQA